MAGPDSSYSALLIHMAWKVDRDDRMEPPIHTEYLPEKYTRIKNTDVRECAGEKERESVCP